MFAAKNVFLTPPAAPSVPVTIQGTTIGTTSSVTIPSHVAGDIIIIFAFRNSSTTVPSKPAASGTVPAYVDIDVNTGANTVSCRTAYFVATSTTETSGTWTNASAMAAIVCRGQNASTPIGGHAESGGSSATMAAPAVTMSKTDGTSVLLSIFGRSGGGVYNAATAGYTEQSSHTAVTMVNAKNDTTSDGSYNQTATGSASYRATQIEIQV